MKCKLRTDGDHNWFLIPIECLDAFDVGPVDNRSYPRGAAIEYIKQDDKYWEEVDAFYMQFDSFRVEDIFDLVIDISPNDPIWI